MYVPVKTKFIISILLAVAWSIFSYFIAEKWINDIAELTTSYFIAYFIIFGIAIIPGFMNAFLISSLLFDSRPKRKTFSVSEYPKISILISAYNEDKNILSTLESINKQSYPAKIEVIVVNDGSVDSTAEVINSVKKKYKWLKFINNSQNKGKAACLNEALAKVKNEIVLTIDGDSYLYKDALKNIVERYMSDPEHTAAVAGAVLVRNSRQNFITKIQEWDYFHGIAAIKRLQSLYQGTLVAQGAFSLYKASVLREVGAWPHCVGEDIVLTWAILKKGYRVGFAEDACLFTNAPDTWMQFFRQRQRWSRGLIEAFKEHWQLLFAPRMITLFIWWNVLFPYMDLVYTLAFIPGLVLAFFGIFWMAGPMTLLVLPLSLLVNYVMFNIQSKMFTSQGLRVRKNIIGFIFYALLYSMVLQPACVVGYVKEFFFGKIKKWGTK